VRNCHWFNVNKTYIQASDFSQKENPTLKIEWIGLEIHAVRRFPVRLLPLNPF